MHQLLSVKACLALLALCLTVVPGLQTIAKAQSPNDLPPCAVPALMESVQTAGCAPTDVKCICSHKKDIFPAVRKAVKDACSEADQNTVKTMAGEYCGKDAAPGASPPTATKSISITTGTSTGSPTTPTTTTTETKKGNGDKMTKTTYHKTMTYATTTTGGPTATHAVNAAGRLIGGVSAGALVAALGGLSLIFAEL